MRNVILKGFPREVDYITEQRQQFPMRIEPEEQGRMRYERRPDRSLLRK
jgi:hypothetical protein